jgi:enamine deaminase RidA (YjgF/YER057c/UK114 family)
MGNIKRQNLDVGFAEEYAYSEIVEARDFVFLTFYVGNVGKSTEEQVNGALDNMVERLKKINLTLEAVVKVDVLMKYPWNIPIMEIVQISGMVGRLSNPCQGLYGASKLAVEGVFETLAKEAAPFNIKLSPGEPGGIRAGFFADNGAFGQELSIYDDQPARDFKRLYQKIRNEKDLNMIIGDPQKIDNAPTPKLLR